MIDWVMKTRGISFRHAVEILQQDITALAAPQPSDKPVKLSRKQQLDGLLSTDAEAQTLLNQVIDYYHDTLKQSPEALNYLESRGLGDRELIERFKLGYANRTLGYRLPRKKTKDGDRLRGQLEAVGIYRQSGHEHLNGSLVVPIFNSEGDVVEVYGRKLLDSLRKGTPKHLYLPGPHAGVWNAESLDNQKEVILCEALIDAMTFWVNGYRNVTASYGTSGFTPDHLQHFKHCGVERVLIAYDRDEAGNNAAEQLAKQLSVEGFDGFRIELPKGMDVNDYALQVTPSQKSLGLVIRKAVWMGSGKAPDRSCASPRPRHTADAEHKQPLDIDSQIGQPATREPEHTDGPSPSLAAKPPTPVITPPAEAVPEAPKADISAEVGEHDITLAFGDRRYRIRGLEKIKSVEVLKVNVLASCGDTLHVD
ncbi:MAG: toprim domain-containing protein, partial [Exilibacterium sp.]